jgi:CRP/FNR family cyclic AMP-dependent transcriptional regulator
MTSEFPIFPELSQDDLRFVADYGVSRTYAKNTILVSEGDPSDLFYIILSGKVKVYLSDEKGKEVLLNIQGPGEYFGELALIDEAPRSASIMTLESCQMAVVSRAGFERCLEEHPSFALGLIRILVRRIRSLTEQVRGLALLDVYGRVANSLLHMATEQEGKLVIDQRLTQQEIANMVGASREMVSRIMKDLSTGGYIRIEDKRIVISRKFPTSW